MFRALRRISREGSPVDELFPSESTTEDELLPSECTVKKYRLNAISMFANLVSGWDIHEAGFHRI